MTNIICNGLVKNNHPKSPIDFFEIITVREYDDYENGIILEQVKDIEKFLSNDWNAFDIPFYQIYGKRYVDDKQSTTIFLGNFESLDKVKDFIYNITGQIPEIQFY